MTYPSARGPNTGSGYRSPVFGTPEFDRRDDAEAFPGRLGIRGRTLPGFAGGRPEPRAGGGATGPGGPVTAIDRRVSFGGGSGFAGRAAGALGLRGPDRARGFGPRRSVRGRGAFNFGG